MIPPPSAAAIAGLHYIFTEKKPFFLGLFTFLVYFLIAGILPPSATPATSNPFAGLCYIFTEKIFFFVYKF